MRLTRTAIVALVLVAVLGAGAAQVLSQRGGGGPPACQPGEREQVLRQEQRAVLRRLGPFTTIRNEEDLATVGKPPYNYIFLAHRFTSFRGLGLTIINGRDTPRPGVPNLVFYKPREGADTTEPERPDFPYELAGWAYGIPYKPGPPPRLLACTTEKDWMIHERGVHPIDSGGFVPMPPAESRFGEAEGGYSDPPAMEPVLGWPHTRSWTIHLWLNGGDVPDSSILDLEDPPSGVDPGVGSSFYYGEKLPEE